MLFCVQNSLIDLAKNPDPWSVLIIRGIACIIIFFCSNFVITAVVSCTVGIFETLSTQINKYFFAKQILGNDPEKSKCFSWFGFLVESKLVISVKSTTNSYFLADLIHSTAVI